MATFLSSDEILAILRSGEFDKLVGLVEDDRFDAKGQPYRLDSDIGRFELAKDIAGFAEEQGGLIVIGLETQPSPLHRDDEVTRWRAIPRSLMNDQQYHDVLAEWLYPTPKIQIEFFEDVRDPRKGLFALTVFETPRDQKPVVIVHMLLDEDRRRDIAVAYVRRLRATVQPTKPADLQRLLRDGKRFDEMHQRLDSIAEEIRRLSEARQTGTGPAIGEPPAILAEEVENRTTAPITAASLMPPIFVLSATPVSKLEIRGLFGGRNSPVVKAFENRPSLRAHGFDLGPSMGSGFEGNRLRRDNLPGWGIVELWRDGFLIYATTAAAGLSWGSMNRPQWPLIINPLALCETTYLFAEWTRRIYEFATPEPAAISYRISFRHLQVGGKMSGLQSSIDMFADVGTAQDSEFTEIYQWVGSQPDSGLVSYNLVAEAFRHFGFEDDKILFARQRDDGVVVIDPELIRSAGRSG